MVTWWPPARLRSSRPPARQSQLTFTARPGLNLRTLLAVVPTDVSALETAPGKYLLRGTIDPPLLAATTAWCADNGVMAEDLRVQQRSLEDVFVELTTGATP